LFSAVEAENTDGCGAKRLGDLGASDPEVEDEKSGAGVAGFSCSLVFVPSLSVEGLGAKILPKGVEGNDFCSVTGLAGVACFGAKRLPNGFPSAGLEGLSCSASNLPCSADGFGANRLPVDGGWNKLLDGAEGAVELVLWENRDVPLVDCPNWNPTLG
jgi:hypothetical protein